MEVVTNPHIVQELICDSGSLWANSMKACETKCLRWLSFFSQFCYWPPLERGHRGGLLFGLTQCWLQMYPMPAVSLFVSFYTLKMSHNSMFWGRHEVEVMDIHSHVLVPRWKFNGHKRKLVSIQDWKLSLSLSFPQQLLSSAFTVIHIHYKEGLTVLWNGQLSSHKMLRLNTTSNLYAQVLCMWIFILSFFNVLGFLKVIPICCHHLQAPWRLSWSTLTKRHW